MSELSDLMGVDPLKLTREDRTKIITLFREKRHLFQTTARAPKAPKSSPAEKSAAKSAAKAALSEDLDLDL